MHTKKAKVREIVIPNACNIVVSGDYENLINSLSSVRDFSIRII